MDHPRIRGEHLGESLYKNGMNGSSPHTRGARHQNRRRPVRTGIIPAYAGSTAAWMAATTAEEDHPRIRGEHVGDLLVDLFDDGSSPHTRGARELLCADRLRCRIIPAYAGSTARCVPWRGT